jgi:hypothetical protein
MKVYIILDESNSDDRTFVEKVFSDKEKAIDYVYADFMKYRIHAGKSKEDLTKEIDRVIHEEEVE